jgi:hypothetical protein
MYSVALLATLAAGAPSLISGQSLAAGSDSLPPTPAVSAGPHDVFHDRLALDRDQQVARELHQVIHKDEHSLDVDQGKLKHARDQVERVELEQQVTVLRGCVAAEQELAREDKHDIKVDHRDLRQDGRG